MSTEPSTPDPGLTIRLLGADDRAAIRRLAERDGAPEPRLPLLGAELDGRLVAAVATSDAGARTVADPFVPTASIVELLRLRTAQLRDDGGRERFAWVRRLTRRPRRRSRATLAGSPPGAGGRLLRL